MHSTNFTVDNKKFCLSLHYKGYNRYLFVNGKEIIKFKARDSQIVSYLLCLRNISKDFNIGYMLNTELEGNVYDFSVDYRAVSNYKIQDAHKYFMGKNNIVTGNNNKTIVTTKQLNI